MESLFGIVNVFWVSRLGAEAIAIVGTTEALLVLVFGIAMGLSMATTALVARRVGEGNPDAAGHAGAQAILLGALVSIVLGVIAFFGTNLLFTMMGAAPGVMAGGMGYGKIILGTNIIIMLLFLINAVFRGAGDAAFAMRALWLGNAINLVLDPCFIFGWGPFPELGVTGSAVATTIGRGGAVLYQLSVLFRQRGRVHITRAQWRPDFPLLREIVQISIGGVFSISGRHGQLDVAGAHRGLFRRQCRGRLHSGHAHHRRDHPAIVGDGECGGDLGRAESGRGQTRAR